MIAQLVQDLLHLERRRDGLDQHRRPDGAPRQAERVLRQVEGVVPEPGLEVAFHLGQVEVRALALGELPSRAVEEVQREIEQAARDALPVDEHVLLLQMPAGRPDHDRGELVVRREPVVLAVGAGEVDGETMLSQSGVFASSKSASHTLAPEFMALIVIFLSVGPVISTLRSTRPAAGDATRQPRSALICAVSGRKSSVAPAIRSCCLAPRAASSSVLLGPSSRCSNAIRSRACGVRISSYRSRTGPLTWIPSP